jgi:hypothetical protein
MSHSLGDGLERSLQALTQGWEEAKNSWQDQRADIFEDSYLNSITTDVKTLLQVLEQLQEIIRSSEKSFPLR